MPNVVGSDEISKKTFGELGGDSLRAQKLQSAVSSCLGVNVPINLLLGQTNLEQVAKWGGNTLFVLWLNLSFKLHRGSSRKPAFWRGWTVSSERRSNQSRRFDQNQLRKVCTIWLQQNGRNGLFEWDEKPSCLLLKISKKKPVLLDFLDCTFWIRFYNCSWIEWFVWFVQRMLSMPKLGCNKPQIVLECFWISTTLRLFWVCSCLCFFLACLKHHKGTFAKRILGWARKILQRFKENVMRWCIALRWWIRVFLFCNCFHPTQLPPSEAFLFTCFLFNGSKRSCIELCSLKPTRFVYVSSAGVLYPFAARGEVRCKEQRKKCDICSKGCWRREVGVFWSSIAIYGRVLCVKVGWRTHHIRGESTRFVQHYHSAVLNFSSSTNGRFQFWGHVLPNHHCMLDAIVGSKCFWGLRKKRGRCCFHWTNEKDAHNQFGSCWLLRSIDCSGGDHVFAFFSDNHQLHIEIEVWNGCVFFFSLKQNQKKKHYVERDFFVVVWIGVQTGRIWGVEASIVGEIGKLRICHCINCWLESSCSLFRRYFFAKLGRAHPLLALQNRFAVQFPYFGDLYAEGKISNSQLVVAMQALPPLISKQVFLNFIRLLRKFINWKK